MNNNELAHYGILGMKWGVRRYQNRDGSLTSAGKKRYVEDENDRDAIRIRKAKSEAERLSNARETAKQLDRIQSRKYKKAEKERSELVDRADRTSKSLESDAKKARDTYETLKKQGEKGSLMKDRIGDLSDSDFESIYGMKVKDYFNQELSYLKDKESKSMRAAKSWAKYRSDLMSMDISSASKKDVTKKAKQLLADAINQSIEDDE